MQALIASHSSLNCSRLPSSISASFISSRSSVVQKNRGPLEPVERDSNPIRSEHRGPPGRLLLAGVAAGCGMLHRASRTLCGAAGREPAELSHPSYRMLLYGDRQARVHCS